ncbi:MAG TPA: hypothetical protein VHD69_02340 [Candidatus Paceibacterota bacterium]|jgi:hypothetical protein|nr:hypothetical protein [Candidatus Paceibacterota bacterium]
MENVMVKVRKVFLIRRLAAPFVFLVAASAVVASTVSVSHVLANMPAALDIPAVARFLVAAFAHTDVLVKSALVAGTLFLLMTLKGAIDGIRLSASLQRI